MITIVIPTRNREYTLRKVLDSYYKQDKMVDEIIIVDDYGEDKTEQIVKEISNKYPNIVTKYIRHSKQKGASAGRITGYQNAKNLYVLFGEDDAFIAPNYCSVLLEKISQNDKIGIVSGRIVYMLPKEDCKDAKIRFGQGTEEKKYLNKSNFTFNTNIKIKKDMFVPFTHALLLTKKSLLQEFGYDPYYAKGNGFREETDFQINIFTHNYDILLTVDTYCYHLHRLDVPRGGQRSNRLKQFYWNTHYTNYMYDKYYSKLQEKLELSHSKTFAKIFFTINQFYILFLRPFLIMPKYFYQKVFR